MDTLPGQDALVAILSADNAPPHVILDIGGSADLDGNGLVKARLDADGALVLEDA
ncbi:hypothetical protein QE430_002467 [Microbacterium testaceum]|uniref:hypothetical protein n=1 Tax=Microbacterium testaceum TaxID=2033 RepID=UPI002781C8A8|nr:hypothetical protein [Microbacterium testaceum]MDQ1174160.1 hypothetical protein [Microbacterium testaceum]